eukprot:gene10147-7104_t
MNTCSFSPTSPRLLYRALFLVPFLRDKETIFCVSSAASDNTLEIPSRLCYLKLLLRNFCSSLQQHCYCAKEHLTSIVFGTLPSPVYVPFFPPFPELNIADPLIRLLLLKLCDAMSGRSDTPPSDHDLDDREDHEEDIKEEGNDERRDRCDVGSCISFDDSSCSFGPPPVTTNFLRKTDRVAHSLLQKYIEDQDGGLITEVIQVLEYIGSPAEVRALLRDSSSTHGPSDGTQSAAFYEAVQRSGAGVSQILVGFPTEPLPTTGYRPSSWEEVAESLHDACKLIERIAGRDDTQLVYKLPRLLQARLAPLLYAWIADWDFLTRFLSTWCDVARCLSLIIHPPRWGCRAPTSLPWRPLCQILLSLCDPVAHFGSSRYCSIQRKISSVLVDLCHRCASWFEYDALAGLWEVCAPHFSPGSQEGAAYLYIFSLLCPVNSLSQGGKDEEAAPVPQPIADLLQFIFVESASYATPLWRAIALETIARIARSNPGLVDLDAYAEPLFSFANRALQLVGSPAKETAPPTRLQGVFLHLFSYELQKGRVVMSIARVVGYSLPPKTTSSLWNQLRRFVHAVQAFLRPDSVSAELRNEIARLFGGLVEVVRSRIETQKTQLGDDSPGLRTNPNSGAASKSGIPPHHVWVDETTTSFVSIVMGGVLTTLDCSGIANNAIMVGELARLSPHQVAEPIFTRISAALTHKMNDLNRQLKALEVLQLCAYPFLCHSAETSELLVAFVQQQILPRVPEWMRENSMQASKRVLLVLWTLCTTVKWSALFSLEEESVFAVTLAEHLIHMATSQTMPPSWFACLRSMLLSFSQEAFDIVAKKVLDAAKSRGSKVQALLLPIGLRDPQRILNFAETHVVPVLSQHNVNDDEIDWASTTLEKCLGCGSREAVFQMAPNVVRCIQALMANLTSSGRQKVAKRLYSALFSALMDPRCTSVDAVRSARGSPASEATIRVRELGFCTSEEVQLHWDVPETKHITFLKNLMDDVLEDIFYLADHVEDLKVDEANPPLKLREMVELGCGKTKVPKTKDAVPSALSESARDFSVSGAIEGLASLLASVMAINGVFYHRDRYTGSTTPAVTPATEAVTLGSAVFRTPALHWGHQKRCCSPSAYLDGAQKTEPKFSLDEMFDRVMHTFLPRVCKGAVPVSELAFGNLLTAFLPPSASSTVEAEDSPRALTSTLTALVTLCNLSPVGPPQSHVEVIKAEKRLYLKSYAGRRSFAATHFPQLFWPLKALTVYHTLESSYTFSASHSRRQALAEVLLRYLFSASPTVTQICRDSLFTLVNQIQPKLRRRILSKSADLMEAIAIKFITSRDKSAGDIFRRLLSDECGESTGDLDKLNAVRSLVGTDDEGEKEQGGEVAAPLKFANQVLTSMLTLLCNWMRQNRVFAFDAALTRTLRLLLAFPSDLCGGKTSIVLRKCIKDTECGIHDHQAVWESVEKLVGMAHRYTFVHPSRAAAILFVCACSVQPWVGMKVKSCTIHQLFQMCTNSFIKVQTQARFLLTNVLRSSPSAGMRALVVPLRDELRLPLQPSPAALAAFQNRYDSIRNQYPFPVFDYYALEYANMFIPRVARIVTFGDAAQHRGLAERLSAVSPPLGKEDAAFWCGHMLIPAAAEGEASREAEELRKTLHAFLVPFTVTPQSIRSSWIWNFFQGTKMPPSLSQTQVSLWSSIAKILGLEVSVPLLTKACELQAEDLADGLTKMLSASAAARDGTKAGERATAQELEERFTATLHVAMGLLRASKDGATPAQRKEVMATVRCLLELGLQPSATQNMVESIQLNLPPQLCVSLTVEDVWGLYDWLLSHLETGESKVRGSKNGADDRQSRWVNNILQCTGRFYAVFRSEFNGQLQERLLKRLRDLHHTIWYGPTQMWRSCASGLVALALSSQRSELLRGNAGAKTAALAFLQDVMASIEFPTAGHAAADHADAPINNTRRLCMIKTFAAVCGKLSVALFPEVVEQLTALLLRTFEISLPEMDDLGATVSFALMHIATTPVPKVVAHEILESWCNMLINRGPESSSPLPRRAATELTNAIQGLLLFNLHRIGKFSMIQLVGEAALQGLSSPNVLQRSSSHMMVAVLTRVASVEQMAGLMSMYEEELKKIDPKRTLRRSALVTALCAAVLADSYGVPPYVPRLMRRLVPLASDASPEVQREAKGMFEQWWQTHRETWDRDIKQCFTPRPDPGHDPTAHGTPVLCVARCATPLLGSDPPSPPPLTIREQKILFLSLELFLDTSHPHNPNSSARDHNPCSEENILKCSFHKIFYECALCCEHVVEPGENLKLPACKTTNGVFVLYRRLSSFQLFFPQFVYIFLFSSSYIYFFELYSVSTSQLNIYLNLIQQHTCSASKTNGSVGVGGTSVEPQVVVKTTVALRTIQIESLVHQHFTLTHLTLQCCAFQRGMAATQGRSNRLSTPDPLLSGDRWFSGSRSLSSPTPQNGCSKGGAGEEETNVTEIVESCALDQLQNLIKEFQSVTTPGTEEVLCLRSVLRGLLDDLTALNYSRTYVKGMDQLTCSPRFTVLGLPGSDKGMVVRFLVRETCGLEKESSPVGPVCEVGGGHFPGLVRQLSSHGSSAPHTLLHHTFSGSGPRVTIHNSRELASFDGEGEPPGPPMRRGTESPPSQGSPNSRSSAHLPGTPQTPGSPYSQGSPPQTHTPSSSRPPSTDSAGSPVDSSYLLTTASPVDSHAPLSKKKNSRTLPAPPANTTLGLSRKQGKGSGVGVGVVVAPQAAAGMKSLFTAPNSPSKGVLKKSAARPNSAKLVPSMIARGPVLRHLHDSLTVANTPTGNTFNGSPSHERTPLGHRGGNHGMASQSITANSVVYLTQGETSISLPPHPGTPRRLTPPSDIVNSTLSRTFDGMLSTERNEAPVLVTQPPPRQFPLPPGGSSPGSGAGPRHLTPRISPKVSLCEVVDHRSQISGYSATPSLLMKQGNGSTADFDMDRATSSDAQLRWRTVRPKVLSSCILEKVLQRERCGTGATSGAGVLAGHTASGSAFPNPPWLEGAEDAEGSARHAGRISTAGRKLSSASETTGGAGHVLPPLPLPEMTHQPSGSSSFHHASAPPLGEEFLAAYEVPWTLLETDQTVLHTQDATPWVPNSIYGDIILVCLGCEDVGKPAVHKTMSLLFGPFAEREKDADAALFDEDVGASAAALVEMLEKPSTAPFSSALRTHSKRLHESVRDCGEASAARDIGSTRQNDNSGPIKCSPVVLQRVRQALATQAIFVLTRSESVFNAADGLSAGASRRTSSPPPIAHSTEDLVKRFKAQVRELYGVTLHEWQVIPFSAATCQVVRDVLYAHFQEKLGGEVHAARSEAGSERGLETMHLSTSTSTFMNDGAGAGSGVTPAGLSPSTTNTDVPPALSQSLSGRAEAVTLTNITVAPRGPSLSLAVTRYCDEVYGHAFKDRAEGKMTNEELQAMVVVHAKDVMWKQSGAELVVHMARSVHQQSATYILSHSATSVAVWAAQLLPLLPLAANKVKSLIQHHHYSLHLLQERLDSLKASADELGVKTATISTSIIHEKVQNAFEEHAQLFLRDIRAAVVLQEEPREMDLTSSQPFTAAYERFRAQTARFRAVCVEERIDRKIEKLRVDITVAQLQHEQRVKAYMEQGETDSDPSTPPPQPQRKTQSPSPLPAEPPVPRRRGSTAQMVLEASTKKRVSAKLMNTSSASDTVSTSTNPASLSFTAETERTRVSALIDPDFESRLHDMRAKRYELEKQLLIAVSQMSTEVINFFEAYISEVIPSLMLAVKEEVVHTLDTLHAARQVLEQSQTIPLPPARMGIHSAQVSISNLLSPHRTVTRSVNSLASVPGPPGSSELTTMIHAIGTTTFLHLPPMSRFSEFATAFRAAICEDVIRSLAKVNNYRQESGNITSSTEKDRDKGSTDTSGGRSVNRSTDANGALIALILPPDSYDDCTPEVVFSASLEPNNRLAEKNFRISSPAEGGNPSFQTVSSWNDSASQSLPVMTVSPTYMLAKRTEAMLRRYMGAHRGQGKAAPPIPSPPDAGSEDGRRGHRSSNPRSNMAAMRYGKTRMSGGQWMSPRNESLSIWRHGTPKECRPIRFMEQPTLWVMLDVLDEALLFTPFPPWVQLELQVYVDKVNAATAQLQRGFLELRTEVEETIKDWEASLRDVEEEAAVLENQGPRSIAHEVTRILGEAKRIAANLDALRDKLHS